MVWEFEGGWHFISENGEFGECMGRIHFVGVVPKDRG